MKDKMKREMKKPYKNRLVITVITVITMIIISSIFSSWFFTFSNKVEEHLRYEVNIHPDSIDDEYTIIVPTLTNSIRNKEIDSAKNVKCDSDCIIKHIDTEKGKALQITASGDKTFKIESYKELGQISFNNSSFYVRSNAIENFTISIHINFVFEWRCEETNIFNAKREPAHGVYRECNSEGTILSSSNWTHLDTSCVQSM